MEVKNIYNLNVYNGTYTVPLNNSLNYVVIEKDNSAPPILNPVVNIIPDPNDTLFEGTVIEGTFSLDNLDVTFNLLGTIIPRRYFITNDVYKFEAIYLNGTWNICINRANSNKLHTISFYMSFEAGEQCTVYEFLPDATNKLKEVYVTTISGIEATDDGTINVGSTTSWGTPSKSPLENVIVPAGSSGNTIVMSSTPNTPLGISLPNGGVYIYCTSLKPTPGGKVHVLLIFGD